MNKSLVSKQLILLPMFFLMFECNLYSSEKNVLLLSGGHSFDTTAFFTMFHGLEGIRLDTMSQPRANVSLEKGEYLQYDAIVFYDMVQEITPGQKEAFIRMTEKGTGLLFLHHSLVSYQEWDEMTKIRGGKYMEKNTGPEKPSGYHHDLLLDVHLVDTEHPVVNNVSDFTIVDEGYTNYSIIPEAEPLLYTNHPKCDKYIAWENRYNQSRVVYLIFGHDKKAYQNKSFQQLLLNSILYISPGKKICHE